MLVSLGLFCYGVLALFSLSALLTAARARLSRRAVFTRTALVLSLVIGTLWLGWREHTGLLTAGVAWAAAAAALFTVGCAAWYERRR